MDAAMDGTIPQYDTSTGRDWQTEADARHEPTPESPESPMASALGQTNASLDRLELHVERLLSRLSPVLGPVLGPGSAMAGEKALTDPEAMCSDVTGAMLVQSRRVFAATERLAEATERLEV